LSSAVHNNAGNGPFTHPRLPCLADLKVRGYDR